ncbi:hypothetical protein BJX99DRAFT_241364 [Aspergillus californicus]
MTLLSMYIVKDLATRFFTNPFWYIGLEPKAAIGQDSQQRKKQEEFASNLFTLSKEFQKCIAYPGPWLYHSTR